MAARKRVCVIGAGPSGIAAAKNCLQAQLDVVVFETNDRVGGNWVFKAATGHSSVYENTHLISSKAWSEYEDFPMPPHYPDYPNHRQLQAYFDSYARHFGVSETIRFRHVVRSVTPRNGSGWDVAYSDAAAGERSEPFDVVMVANGHHWDPKHPEIEGSFDGTLMHSHAFKGLEEDWRGKAVLVIGGGNSACDVAVEAARISDKVCLSMRNPQWFVPKFIFGMPADEFAARSNWIPRAVRQRAFALTLRLLQGPYSRYGLPMNRTLPLTHHLTLNSDLIDYVRHGRILPRPGVARFDGRHVVFSDGRREPFDIVCACTGFRITFPFFAPALVDFSSAERVPLFRKMMHPDYEDLYFIGLVQPSGCVWPLADHQAKLACAEIRGRYKRPGDMRRAIRHEMDHPHYAYSGGTRHSVEVDYHLFRKELKAELKKAGIDIGSPPRGIASKYKTSMPGTFGSRVTR